MNKSIAAGAIAMLLSGPALAQNAPTLEGILRELAALTERVERLEQDNARLQTENAALKVTPERQVAQDAPQAVEAMRVANAAEWAPRLSWTADLRYRHDYLDAEEAPDDQTRHRIRARLALRARISDTLSGTIGIATNSDTGDPRTTMQTLGDGGSRKGLGLDLAYVDWQPVQGLGLAFGKMPQPWYKATGFFFDNDLNPEGIAVRYATGPFFAHAFGYWLSERSAASDATLLGGQLGMTGQLGDVKLTGALGYFDVGAVQGEITTPDLSVPCVHNGAFFAGPQGNTTFTDASGCSRLLHDYNMVEAIGQAEFQVGNRPAQVFVQAIRNQEADQLDTGWLAGFTFGKAADPQTWEFGYAYGVIEKDAHFGQLIDSDFAGGVTDVDGGILKVGYAPARDWMLNGTYYMNQRFIDAPGATERSYDRYQIDLNWKF
ncbi:MAG: hypothetical protein FJ171_03720 [Gammaproteobacteria bacterium]|nr:hypothetical protein [Gammaproteobacteria bacterium]